MNQFQRLAFLLCAGATVICQAAVQLPGARPDGSVLLPNQWSLRPVGKQTLVGDFPVNIAVHPSGKFAVVLHAGHGANELVSVALPSGKIVASAAVDQAFYGLTFDREGGQILASGGDEEVLHVFSFKDGLFGDHRRIEIRNVKERGVVSGIALDPDGGTAYVTELFGMSVVAVDLAAGKPVWRLPLAPGAAAIPAVVTKLSEDPDLAAAEKRAAARKETIPDDAPWPYGCVLDKLKGRLYVSLWGRSEIAVVDLTRRSVAARWAVQEHPNEMVLSHDGKYLFVANANRNSVTILDTGTGAGVETLLAAIHPVDAPGATPNSLALSPDEHTLFIANAGVNCVAVFDVEHPGKSTSLGLIPVGWYPTSVRVTPTGGTLLVANGKGLTSKANRHGPQAGRESPASEREYIGGLMQGTVSIVKIPGKREDFVAKLSDWTAVTLKCSPLPMAPIEASARGKVNPIPVRVGDPSPIKHVIYIIKENRTYDQVLGDVAEGNGDPGLCLFPEDVTPNHHRLAREFVLLDNFYVDGEVSADGHEWTMGAYATEFVEKLWPLSYGHNGRSKIPYPSEGNFAVAHPANHYLWDRAKEAGVSYRSYGEFVGNGTKTNEPCKTRVKSLEGHFDPWFRSFDLDYPDAMRADRLIAELHRFEQEGDMPKLQIVRLPNDHTYGTSPGKLTPRAQVADNDLALGRVVDAVSHSKFWPNTAIFVLEDDAQNGPDHIDAHRSIAFVVSPFARRHSHDTTMYSTCSMLRTMELILGLKPMSQFDEAAQPMYGSFQAKPDLHPYKAVPVPVDFHEKNATNAWGADLSAQMNFQKEDAADDNLLNQVVWHSVRGPKVPMPAPVRAAFIRAGKGDDDDGD